jgi:transcriptional regulator with XRE-family HTH domain
MEHSDLSFGEYLKSLRKAKALTAYKLAKDSGVSHPFIHQIESGKKSNVSPEIIRKLSQALGCTHIGMMIKAGHVTEQEVFGWIEKHR